MNSQKQSSDSDTNFDVVRLLTEDIQAHREYIQKLYLSAFAVGAVLFSIGLGIGYYVLGKQLDARVFEYRIVDSLRERAEQISSVIVEEARRGAQDEVSRYIGDEIERVVEQELALKLQEFTSESLTDIVEGVALPRGMISSFTTNFCPQGWVLWSEGTGRVIVGAGQGQGLSNRSMMEVGGTETHQLTVSELPEHRHSTIQMIGTNEIDGVDSTTTNSGEHHNEARETGATGEGAPHNNMMPYIAVRLCLKR